MNQNIYKEISLIILITLMNNDKITTMTDFSVESLSLSKFSEYYIYSIYLKIQIEMSR